MAAEKIDENLFFAECAAGRGRYEAEPVRIERCRRQ